jgi:hypothetical protein
MADDPGTALACEHRSFFSTEFVERAPTYRGLTSVCEALLANLGMSEVAISDSHHIIEHA